MSDNTISIHRENDPESITITGLVALSEKVGKNSSDIEKLKEETNDLGGLKVEVEQIKTNQKLTDQKLDQLNINDSRIEQSLSSINKGTSTFRYWLWGAVVLIFGCMFGTLIFGLELTERSQQVLQTNLQKQISDSDKRHTKNFDKISDQIGQLSRDINK